MKKRGVTFFEVLVVIAVISVMAYYGFQRYADMMVESRENALKQELKVIRDSIEIFKMRNGKYPNDLKELEEKGYMEFGGSAIKEFGIEYKKKDKLGRCLDPFGKPYKYNKKNGIIKSGDIKYSSW